MEIVSMLMLAASLGGTPAESPRKDADTAATEEFLGAVSRGEKERVQAMLGADPALARAKNKDGVSAVLLASYHRKPELVPILLSTGIELDVFEASAAGQTARVRELLDRDRSLANAVAADGFFPLALAAFFRHREVAELLLARGAEVNLRAQNAMKVMALHSASAARQLDICRALIAAGADVNARQQAGFTPLHEAAHSGNLALAELLLSSGADPNLSTEEGKTALALARERNHAELAALLVRSGARE